MPVDLFSLFKRSKHSPRSSVDDMSTKPTIKTSGGRTSTSSDPNRLADAFGRLSLGDGRQRGFVGGFAPRSGFDSPSPARVEQDGALLGTPHAAFPEPNRHPAPGLLPVPPAIPMPTPHTSLTMRYALGGSQDAPTGCPPPPPPKDGLRPPAMTRPHSDSGLFPSSSSSHLQVPLGTPQRPHLQQTPNSAPAKPVSSAPNSRPSPLQTPTKRPRATSSPPSPTTSITSKGGLRVQCSGVTKQDKRCTRMVAISAPLARLNGDHLPHYCHQHLKGAFMDVQFTSHKDPSVKVQFDAWVPEYLQEETRELLRDEMRKRRSDADEAGYIYAFEIDDPTNRDVVNVKVGRAVKLTKRLAEWDKQCQSKQTHLRGFWPTTPDAERGNLGRGRVQVGAPGPWCHKVEKLVHLELADLALNAPYLDPSYPNVKGGSGSGSDRVYRAPCPDCDTVHKEIFTFPRGKGRYKGKEWEDIVKPVIEKWGGFVEAYV